MHERQRAGAALVLQVGVELGQLVADQHALVVKGARGARRHIQASALRSSSHTRRITYSLRSNASWSSACAGPAPTNSWRISGRQAPGDLTRVLRRHRHVAPAEHRLALRDHGPLQQLLQSRAASLVRGGQEAHQHPVATRRRQLELDHRTQQLVGHLHQDPRAVARARVRTGGAPVLEVLQRGDPPLHDLVRGRVVQTRDHPHAARVVLEAGVVETDGLGRLHGVRSHGSAPWGRCSPHEHSSRGHGRTPEAEPERVSVRGARNHSRTCPRGSAITAPSSLPAMA